MKLFAVNFLQRSRLHGYYSNFDYIVDCFDCFDYLIEFVVDYVFISVTNLLYFLIYYFWLFILINYLFIFDLIFILHYYFY